jgi:alpha-beta hydrolase superfamily lysophospholipase
MHDPEDAGFESESFDPDEVVWVRGVDYVAGWRDATDAGGELADALAAAGFDTTGLEWRGQGEWRGGRCGAPGAVGGSGS